MPNEWETMATAQQQAALSKPTQFVELPPASPDSPAAQPPVGDGPGAGQMINIGQNAQGQVTGQYGGNPWQQEAARLATKGAMDRGENLVPYLAAQAKLGPGLDNSRQQQAYEASQQASNDANNLTTVGGILNSDAAALQKDSSPNDPGRAAEQRMLLNADPTSDPGPRTMNYPQWAKFRRQFQIENPDTQLPPDLAVFQPGMADQKQIDAAYGQHSNVDQSYGTNDRPLLHDESMQHDARVLFGQTNPGQQLPSSIQGTAEQRLQAQNSVMAQNIRQKLGPAWNNLPDEQVVSMHDEQVAQDERALVLGTIKAALPANAPFTDEDLLNQAKANPMMLQGALQKVLLPQLAAQAQKRINARQQLNGPLPGDTNDQMTADQGLVGSYLTQQMTGQMDKRLFPGAPAMGDLITVLNSASLGLPGLMMRHFQGASDLVARGLGKGPASNDASDPRDQMWQQMEQGYQQAHPYLSQLDSFLGYMAPVPSLAGALGKVIGPLTGAPVSKFVLSKIGDNWLAAIPAQMVAKAAGGAVEMPFFGAATSGIESGGDLHKALAHLDPRQQEFWTDAASGFLLSGATAGAAIGAKKFLGDGLGMIATTFNQLFKTRPSVDVELRPDATPEEAASFSRLQDASPSGKVQVNYANAVPAYRRVQAAWDLINHDQMNPADALKRAGVTAQDLATAVGVRAGYAERVISKVIDTKQNPWQAEADGVAEANKRNAETAAAQPETRLAPGDQPIHPSDFKAPIDPYEGLGLTAGERKAMASVEKAEGQMPAPAREWANTQLAALHPEGKPDVENNPAATAQIVEQAHNLVAGHPAELQDPAAVGRWYAATYKDPLSAPIIETLANLGKEGKATKYVQALVPPEIVNGNSVMAGDLNDQKVGELAAKSHIDRANMPPAIFVDGHDQLTTADGAHRLAAAVQSGDPFVRAYVPEHWIGKQGVRRAGESAPEIAAGETGSSAQPETTGAKTPPDELERRGGLGGNEPWELTKKQFLNAAPVERGESMTIRKAGSQLVPALRINGTTYADPRAQTHGHVLTPEALEKLDPGMKAIPGYVKPGSSEFIYQLPKSAHKAEVQGALNRGEHVPEHVLAEYPNLKAEPNANRPQQADRTGSVADATGITPPERTDTTAGGGGGVSTGDQIDSGPAEDAGTSVAGTELGRGEVGPGETAGTALQTSDDAGGGASVGDEGERTGSDIEAGPEGAKDIERTEADQPTETTGQPHGPGVTAEAIKSAFADSGKPLDPSRLADARKILEQWKKREAERIKGVAGGLSDFDAARRAAVDEAFRTVAKPIKLDSSMPDMQIWAMPGKEAEIQKVADEAAKIAGRKWNRPNYYKKRTGKPFTRAIPKPAKSNADVIKLFEKNATGRGHDQLYTANDGRTIIATDGHVLWEATNRDLGATWGVKSPEKAIPEYEREMQNGEPMTTVYAPEAIRRLRQIEVIKADRTQVLKNGDGSLGFASAGEAGQAEVNVRTGARPLGFVNPVYLREALEAHIVAGHDSPKLSWGDSQRAIKLESETISRRVRTLVMPTRPDAPETYSEEADDGGETEAAQVLRGAVGPAPQLGDEQLFNSPAPEAGQGQQAKKGKPGAPRIQVDPLPGGDPKKLKQIILDFGAGIGKQVRTGVKMPRNAGGVYNPNSTRTSVLFQGDLDITAHEIGHMLDDRWGIVSTWATAKTRSPFDSELMPNFSAYGSGTASGPRSTLAYHRAEGVAEWVRAFVVNPAEAIAAAPKFSTWFKSQISPADYTALKEFSKDVRRWAGMSNADRVISNIRMANDRTPIIQQVKNFITGGDQPGFKLNAWDRAIVNFADDLHGIVKGIDFLKTIRPEITEDSPGGRAPAADVALARIRNFAGQEPKLLDIIDNGPIRFEPRDPRKAVERADGIGGGAEWLLGRGVLGMEHLDWEQVQRRHSMAAAYLDSQRVVEKAEQIRKAADEMIKSLDPTDPKWGKKMARITAIAEARISRMAGWGGGIFNDESTARHALEEIAADPHLLDQVKQIAERYRAWGTANLKYMRDGGRLSKEAFDTISASNQFYSDMHRIMEPIMGESGAGSRKLGSPSEPLQKFKGSTRQLDNPFVGLLKQTSAIVRETDRNAAMDAFTSLARTSRGMHQGQARDLDAVASRGRPGDKDTIPVWHRGEREEWNFAPDLHKALKGFGDRPEQSLALRLASLFLKRVPQHALATYNPQFWIRQAFRTTFHLGAYSQTGVKPLDIMKGRSADDRTAMRLYGGDMGRGVAGTSGSFRDLVEQRLKTLANDQNTVLAIPGRAFRSIEHAALHLSGGFSRGVEFRKSFENYRAQGYRASDAAQMAALQSRELIDYAVGGRLVKSIDRFIPFLNAGVQHSLRLPRAIRKNPLGALMRLALTSIVPAILNYLWNAATGNLDEWRELPDWRRDFALNFKVGHLWVSIPTPYEQGAASNLFVRALDGLIHGGKVNPFSGYGSSIKHGMMHFDEAMGLAGPLHTVMELKANHSDFFNRSIIPPGDEGKALELREGSAHASRLGEWLGKVMGAAGMSADPRKIDYFLQQTGGGIEHVVSSAMDLGRKDKPGLSNLLMSASGIATAPPAYTSRSVQALQEKAKQLGEDQSPEMAAFNKLLHAQASAPDLTTRDQLAAQVRAEASALLDHYNEVGPQIMASKEAVMADRDAHRQDRPLGSPAERLAEALQAAKSSGQPQTMQQRQRIDAEQNYTDTLRTDPHAAGLMIEKYIQQGVLRKVDVDRMQQRATLPRLQNDIQGLDANDSMRVWEHATPGERSTIRPFVLEKVGRSQTLDLQTRLGYLRTLGVEVAAPQ